MSYWAGYSGQGLCLTQDEYETFLNDYTNVQTAAGNHEALCEMEKLNDDGSLEDIWFASPSGEKFSLFCADDGCTEGFRLVPYRIDGNPNKKWDECPQTLSDNMYVLLCDRPIDGMECFEKKAYASYEEFVGEFKRKMESYLPKDFDWDAHIGIYTYACYA